MPILHKGGNINLAIYIHIELFIIVGSQVWLNHHGRALFPLPNTKRTTITNQANWSYNDEINTEGDK